MQETKAYDFADFVSDLGGLSGLFLGLSFWTLWRHAKMAVQKAIFGKGPSARKKKVNGKNRINWYS